MELKKITAAEDKRRMAREVLEALPDWFGIEETREQYIRESGEQLFFAAEDGNEAIGFLCLKETGKATVELAVMGVKMPWHRQGIGLQLFGMAKEAARQQGYHFMQVKTVKMGCYEDYDSTNLFYQSLGFEEMEVLPLWDEQNPCQIYIMAL